MGRFGWGRRPWRDGLDGAPLQPAEAARPPLQGTALLLEVLLGFRQMATLEFRQSLLAQLVVVSDGQRIDAEVGHRDAATPHLREMLRSFAARPDPLEPLDWLCAALGDLAPHEGALPWLRLTVHSMRGRAPLPVETMLALIDRLRRIPPQQPERLRRYLTERQGVALLRPEATLPEIMLRLADRRGAPDPGPLVRFLTALTADESNPSHHELAALKVLLTGFEVPVDERAEAAEAGRLIVQIRLEAQEAEHLENGRYLLRASCYRQSPTGGPLEWIDTLGPVESFTRSELIQSGSARLTAWEQFTQEQVNAAGGRVRIEFLLPTPLLGHPAELWEVGDTRRPLGRNHPVVVRSLERYKDRWLNDEAWRDRWSQLCGGAPAEDPIGLIGWPPLLVEKAAELQRWVAEQPTLACLGLSIPYDGLEPELRGAVDEVLFEEGMPVLLWRRDQGDPSALLAALREHEPACLTELPETVHRCRRKGRLVGADDVRNNITLFWDDPDCVDPAADRRYAGMV
ncbi:VMAP-C domain-containing protein [Kitasatospora azatica]|uniref:VMAP-C domain-containing protein n=1 Tax=Kitasatospora azatica TaxID=58347 RepID=UPI00055C7EE1|nr:hypothetical protein [Kitasatospora azatica]